MNNKNINCIQEDEIDLKELWNTIAKRKFFIFAFTTVVTILAVVWAYTRTPIYEVKSNLQIGYIGDNLIADPNTLVKTANLVFNVEDKVSSTKPFVSEVSSISTNKKLKNFIEIKTQAISNEAALEKNKEVVSYIQKKYKSKIDQFINNNNNNIKAIKVQIKNLEELETNNLKREIKLLRTQKIVQIDEKIKKLKTQTIEKIKREINLLKTQKIATIDDKINFFKNITIMSFQNKILFHTTKLKEYSKAIEKLYSDNISDDTAKMVSAMQMVNYQNLILNSQNKIEDLKIEIAQIENEIVPTLELEHKNIENITIKDLKEKIFNIENITIKNLEQKKKNIQNDTLRKLEYKLKVELPNKKVKLLEKIEQYKFQNSDQNIQNSKVIGNYVVHDYPIKPKKKLIVIVAFVTGLILSIFLVFFLEFISGTKRD